MQTLAPTIDLDSSSHGNSQRRRSNHRNGLSPVVADFCCGMGGFSLAAVGIGLTPVFGLDTNCDAIKTYGRNFPTAVSIEGSVRSVSAINQCKAIFRRSSNEGRAKIVISGPPCQGFSIAGSRDPSDPRNQILDAVARTIAELQPDCALIENVPMLLSSGHEGRISRVTRTLSNGGYHVCMITLDASDYGVAQRRKRVFFFVSRGELDAADLNQRLNRKRVPQIKVSDALSGIPSPNVRPDKYDDEVQYGVFFNHLAMQHSEKVMQKIAAIPPGKGPMSYRRLHPDEPSNTLFSGNRAPPAHFAEPRSITVREAARLQGFPDTFRVFGSFGNQMRQVTNAVPPPLAKVALEVLLELTGVQLP